MLLAAVLMVGMVGAGPEPAPAPAVVPAIADVAIHTSAAAVGSAPITSPITASDPQVLLGLINDERAKAGLPSLKWDERMSRAALEHAQLMSQEGRLSHQFAGEPDLLARLTAQDVRLDQGAENVVYDWTVQGAHLAFMGSLHHRANMMNAAYDTAGIAVVASNGVLYVVEDFAHMVSDVSDEEAATQIAGRFAELRQSAGGTGLAFFTDQRLRAHAASMAEREALDSSTILHSPGVRFAASYATADPSSIPAQVSSLAAQQGVSSYSVAVHFARTPKYPSGLFWVAVALCDSNTVASR